MSSDRPTLYFNLAKLRAAKAREETSEKEKGKHVNLPVAEKEDEQHDVMSTTHGIHHHHIKDEGEVNDIVVPAFNHVIDRTPIKQSSDDTSRTSTKKDSMNEHVTPTKQKQQRQPQQTSVTHHSMQLRRSHEKDRTTTSSSEGLETPSKANSSNASLKNQQNAAKEKEDVKSAAAAAAAAVPSSSSYTVVLPRQRHLALQTSSLQAASTPLNTKMHHPIFTSANDLPSPSSPSLFQVAVTPTKEGHDQADVKRTLHYDPAYHGPPQFVDSSFASKASASSSSSSSSSLTSLASDTTGQSLPPVITSLRDGGMQVTSATTSPLPVGYQDHVADQKNVTVAIDKKQDDDDKDVILRQDNHSEESQTSEASKVRIGTSSDLLDDMVDKLLELHIAQSNFIFFFIFFKYKKNENLIITCFFV